MAFREIRLTEEVEHEGKKLKKGDVLNVTKDPGGFPPRAAIELLEAKKAEQVPMTDFPTKGAQFVPRPPTAPSPSGASGPGE